MANSENVSNMTQNNTAKQQDSIKASVEKTDEASYNKFKVGDIVFPMLYLYFYAGNACDKSIPISDEDKALLVKGMKIWSKSQPGDMGKNQDFNSKVFPMYHTDNQGPTTMAKRHYKMFLDAMEKNPNYKWMLCNACTNLLAKYKGRIPISGGAYYQNNAKTKTSYWPILDNHDPAVVLNCMKLLKLLYQHSIIDATYSLGIRGLDISTGEAYYEEQYTGEIARRMRVAGKPIKGMFRLNSKVTTPQMFKTFSGIDIKAVASVGNVVTELNGMSQLSWSVHSGKTTQKPLGKNNGGARTSGTRTIAGSMVFTLFDHHPLLDLVPDDLTEYQNRAASSGKQKLYRPRVMPDQLPPFDMSIILMNEYGFASVLTLYGIQVVDEGSVISTDNLITEVVCQYTAVAMDPIVQVEADESGNIDPFGLLSGGWSDFWKQREIVIAGVAYSDLENAYEAFYDANVDNPDYFETTTSSTNSAEYSSSSYNPR